MYNVYQLSYPHFVKTQDILSGICRTQINAILYKGCEWEIAMNNVLHRVYILSGKQKLKSQKKKHFLNVIRNRHHGHKK